MSRAWVFQAVPEVFDMRSFLDAALPSCLWKVSRYGDEMAVDDKVFVWCGKKGGDPSRAGVVAFGRIAGRIRERADRSEAARYWLNGSDTEVCPRVLVQILSHGRLHVSYEDVATHPLFNRHQLITARAGTNFRLDEAQFKAMHRMYFTLNPV